MRILMPAPPPRLRANGGASARRHAATHDEGTDEWWRHAANMLEPCWSHAGTMLESCWKLPKLGTFHAAWATISPSTNVEKIRSPFRRVCGSYLCVSGVSVFYLFCFTLIFLFKSCFPVNRLRVHDAWMWLNPETGGAVRKRRARTKRLKHS